MLGELKDGLDDWEERNGKPFLINGENFHVLYDSELSKAGLKRSAYAVPPPRRVAAQQPSSSHDTPVRPPSSSRTFSMSSRTGPMSTTPRIPGTPLRPSPAKPFLKPSLGGKQATPLNPKARIQDRPAGRDLGSNRTFSMSSTTSFTPGQSRNLARAYSANTPSRNGMREPVSNASANARSPTRASISRVASTSSTASMARTPSKGLGAPVTPGRKPMTPNMNLQQTPVFRSRSELGDYPKYNEGPPSRRNISPMRAPGSPLKDGGDGTPIFPPGSRILRPRLGSISATAGTSGIPNRSMSSLGSYRATSTSPHKRVPVSARVTGGPQRGAPVRSSSHINEIGLGLSVENWQADTSSNNSHQNDDDEFHDPAYVKWQEEALERLEIRDHTLTSSSRTSKENELRNENDEWDLLVPPVPQHERAQRISDFNWEKDVF